MCSVNSVGFSFVQFSCSQNNCCIWKQKISRWSIRTKTKNLFIPKRNFCIGFNGIRLHTEREREREKNENSTPEKREHGPAYKKWEAKSKLINNNARKVNVTDSFDWNSRKVSHKEMGIEFGKCVCVWLPAHLILTYIQSRSLLSPLSCSYALARTLAILNLTRCSLAVVVVALQIHSFYCTVDSLFLSLHRRTIPSNRQWKFRVICCCRAVRSFSLSLSECVRTSRHLQ